MATLRPHLKNASIVSTPPRSDAASRPTLDADQPDKPRGADPRPGRQAPAAAVGAPPTVAASVPTEPPVGPADDAPTGQLPAPRGRTRSYTLTVPAVAAQSGLVDEFQVPLVEIPTEVFVTDGLDAAIAHRTIFAVIGEKGLGKSVATDTALAEFQAQEGQKPLRERRAVCKVSAPPASQSKLAHMLGAIWRVAVGDTMPTKAAGKSLAADELTERLVAELQNLNVVALVVDNAEQLNDDTLAAIIAVVETAQRTAATRYRGTHICAAGIGVLLVGTSDLSSRLRASIEAGHRISAETLVGGISPQLVADLYCQFLPCFRRQAEHRGADRWREFIEDYIAHRPVSIREIEQHTREYVRRASNAWPQLRRIEDLPWDEQLFLTLWRERLKPSSAA